MPRLSPRLRQPVHSDTNPWSPLLRYFHNPFYAWQAVQLPLSGDVTQAINPWSWTFGSATSQIGLAMPAPCRIGASIMLGFQPFKGAPVHSIGLPTFAVQNSRLPSTPAPNNIGRPRYPVMINFSLARIGQLMAMPAGEGLNRQKEMPRAARIVAPGIGTMPTARQGLWVAPFQVVGAFHRCHSPPLLRLR